MVLTYVIFAIPALVVLTAQMLGDWGERRLDPWISWLRWGDTFPTKIIRNDRHSNQCHCVICRSEKLEEIRERKKR